MTPAARIQAAIELIDYISEGAAAEQALTRWARGARYAGSKDRAAVRDLVFDALRCWRSCAAIGGGSSGRATLLGLLRQQGVDPDTIFTGEGHAPSPLSEGERVAGHAPAAGAEALDMPDWIWPRLSASLGDVAAAEAAAQMRARAPVMLRVNLRKSDVKGVVQSLENDGVEVEIDTISESSLRVISGARRLRRTAAYADGLVELQDGSCQAAMEALTLPAGGRVLDYCAGGGGKLLALAARGDAAFHAHDAAPRRMADLPSRAARAGVTANLLATQALQDAAPFDLVLCDAPCSGSGTWRRTPEAKWRLTPERLADLTATQSQILGDAAPLVRAGGTLAYATCSLLTEENEARIEGFLKTHPGWVCELTRRWSVGPSGDGFFLACLTRK